MLRWFLAAVFQIDGSVEEIVDWGKQRQTQFFRGDVFILSLTVQSLKLNGNGIDRINERDHEALLLKSERHPTSLRLIFESWQRRQSLCTPK